MFPIRNVFLLSLIFVFLTSPSVHTLPAFPGAEGFGSDTPGGRGGKVIEVTTLADSGPGSLREACTTPGKRIVVFTVGGTIELESHLRVAEPYITIAAQTAPGGGILLRNAGLYIETHDAIVRGIRVRIGPSLVEEYDTQDPLHIEGEGCHDIVVDHCSFSWSIDEAIGISAGAHDVTFSWNIVSEPLEKPFTKEEIGKEREHAYGLILGNNPDRISVHHNLVAHAQHRSPRIQGGLIEFSNNLVYNWGYFAAVLSRNPRVNFIGNFYKPGNNSRIIPPLNDNVESMGRIYVRGNLSPMRFSDEMPEWELTCAAPEETHRAFEPFETAALTLTSAEKAYEAVLAGAGARTPELDTVDRRILRDVRYGTGWIINRPEEVGGYPEIEPGEPPEDNDHDGIPNDWEQAHGLDPNDPEDAASHRDGSGYTNIEEYLNSLIEESLR